MGKKEGKFNIRVYGIVFNEQLEILLSDENHFGIVMTKFPGGGLKYGEGTLDCLKREFLEELRIMPLEIEHFYTTDFFQKAYFFENTQLISIYYNVKIPDDISDFPHSATPLDIKNIKDGDECFRWSPLKNISESLTLPVDKHVGRLLENRGII